MERCVNRCEFLRFGDGRFRCQFYKSDLKSENVFEKMEGTDGKIAIYRCGECIEEGEIGSNTIGETVRKLKNYIGWTMDSFYSFKDDIETNITEMYRILKSMEDKDED